MPSVAYKHVQGADELCAAFKNLSEDMRERTLAAGVKALLQPIKVAAKRFAHSSRETGALEASIVEKVVNYPRNGKAVGLVGPDRNYYALGKKVKGRLSRLLARGQRKPANYAHLVEFGHIVATAKKGSGARMIRYSKKEKTRLALQGEAANTGSHRAVMSFVPPRPFIRPAVDTTLSQQSTAFYEGIEKGFSAAVRREERAGRHVRSK